MTDKDDDDESFECGRCGGSGYDPDQSEPTYEELVTATPRACRDCNGCGRIDHPWSWRMRF